MTARKVRLALLKPIYKILGETWGGVGGCIVVTTKHKF